MSRTSGLARALVDYLGGLEVTQGRLAGQPFPVLPWERRFIRGAFRRGVAEAGLSVARGNGKTTLCAGLACSALDGPLAVRRGDTVLVASSFEQARISFEHVLAFMGPAAHDKRRYRLWDSTAWAQIQRLETGARVRCIGSDPKRAHGLAPRLILADEPAQWPENTGERMVAALRTAAGKLPECLFLALGTRPDSETHWFAKLLDDGDYAQVHAARPGDPPYQKRTWQRANPSLAYMPDLEAAIRSEARRARRDPTLAPSFEALRLNLGTADTARSLLLAAATWRRIEGEADREGRCLWGVDLGTSAAQSAVAAYWPDSGRLEVLAAFPREPDLSERGLADGVGALYTQCARRGELIQTGGAAVDVAALMTAARDHFGAPARIACDRWREAELRDALKACGLRAAAFELRGMGFKDGAEDVRAFRRLCLEGAVTPLPSLLLTSAMAEARTVQDPAGNAKLAKGAEGGRRLRARDDAAAAAVLAVGLASRMPKRAGGVYHGIAG